MGLLTSSSSPKLNFDLGSDFLTLFLSLVAKVLGDSSTSSLAITSYFFSGDVGLVRPAGFDFVRLKMTGDVEAML